MKLSVVIPAYNEESRISVTLRAVHSYLIKQDYEYEIIVVVNGSTDKTYDIVTQLAASEIKNIRTVNIPEGGKGNAVTRGILDYAEGDFIIFMDADESSPVNEVEKFFPWFEQGYDVVVGSRYLDPTTVKVRQPLYRVILSRGSNILIQLLAVHGIKDTQVGFKGFTKACAKDIFRFVSVKGWGFDFELLSIAQIRGDKIKEVAVSWTEHGGGHVPLMAYIQSLLDLFRIKFKALRGDYNK